jgi:hypothetical protein
MTEQDIRFQCDEPFQTNIDIYIALTETAVPAISSNNKTICSYTEKTTPSDHGYFIHTNRQWLSGDSIHFVQKHRIYSETTNHQGICFFLRNRLMSLPVAESFIPVAACDMPFISDGKVYLKIGKISHWKEENGLLHDIPVLPEITDDTYIVILSPYSGNNTGISMFPRGRKHG